MASRKVNRRSDVGTNTSLKRCKVVYTKESGKVKKGLSAHSVCQLLHLACTAFQVKEDGAVLTLDDGTEVDDDDYFALLPNDTVFTLIPPKTKKCFWAWTMIDRLINKVWRLPTPPKEDLESFLEHMVKNEETKRQIQIILDKSIMNLNDNRKDDQDWFCGLKTNVTSKEEWMKRNAKERIRAYFIKSKDDVEHLLFGSHGRKLSTSAENWNGNNEQLTYDKFDHVFESMRNELDTHQYYSGYFARRSEKLRLCNNHGCFTCHGKYNELQCDYVHQINPYGNKESRIMFSTWNLDHVIERTRSIVPAITDAILEAKPKQNVNWKYFYNLLFVACHCKTKQISNLKLVHTVCHVKAAHKQFLCDKKQFY